MKKLKSFLFLFLFLASFLTGTENPKKPAYVKDQWVSEVRLSGAYQLRKVCLTEHARREFLGKGRKVYCRLQAYQLDLSNLTLRPHPKKEVDQQAWIGLGSVIVPRTREVRTEDLRMRGGLYYARGDKEPFNGKQITPRSDGSKWLEMPCEWQKAWQEDLVRR